MSINVYIQNMLCGYERDDPMVCCPIQVEVTTAPAPAQGAFYFGGGPTQAPAPAPTTTPAVSSGFQFLTNSRDQCGVSNASFLRVVGGENAALHAWPWMAALGYKSSTDFATRFLCGGSLITSMVSVVRLFIRLDD
jgi:serine protease 56